ncbi:MAG: TIGR03546 family protein [Spirochaetes bacterium]|nr:TIGR03546 family protein [Spirochaetota bacterium]
MVGLKFVGKIFKALRSASSPRQIAGGFILGMLIGLVSLKSLFSAVAIILILVLNVNVAMAASGYAVFRLVTWLVDPWLHTLGYSMLAEAAFLQPAWIYLYNLPLVSFTRFNNTVVMGGFTAYAVLVVPVFILIKRFVVVYRERLEEKVNRWKIVQAVKGSRLFEWVGRITGIGA